MLEPNMSSMILADLKILTKKELEKIQAAFYVTPTAEVVSAFTGSKALTSWPMAVQRASTERAAILRSSALSLANICSMGLRSGE